MTFSEIQLRVYKYEVIYLLVISTNYCIMKSLISFLFSIV